jgi:ribosomal protein L22
MAKAPDNTATKAPQQPRSADASQAPTVRAKARFVRVAPRKARLVADQVRGLPVTDARTLLEFSPRGAARDLARLIDSAAANAEANHDLVADDLRIAAVNVDEGPTLKRWRARARGRATRIEKKTSHLSVALTPSED